MSAKEWKYVLTTGFVLAVLGFSVSSKAYLKLDSIDSAVLKSIYKVYGQKDRQHFHLGNAERTKFVLHDPAGKGSKEIKCRKNIRFLVVAYANDMGWISTGVCDYGKPLTRDFIAAQPGLNRTSAATLFEVAKQTRGEEFYRKTVDELGKMQSETLANGDAFYFFKFSSMAAGFQPVPTGLLVGKDQKRVLIVQYRAHSLCRETRVPQAICETPVKSMKAFMESISEKLDKLSPRK